MNVRRPSEVRPVQVSGAGSLVGLDGLLGRRDGTVLGATNDLGAPGGNALVELRSNDGWRTARLVAVRPSTDPAVTAVTPGPDGGAYLLSGRMDVLFSGTTTDSFTLRRV